MTNAQHSAVSNEHYTPGAISHAAWVLMGQEIELDPASCQVANDMILAKRYFTKADSGLAQAWEARSLFLNPPGGTTKGRSNQALWWDKLEAEYLAGNTKQAVFFAFSVELIGKRPNLLNYPCCFTSREASASCINGMGRVKFLNEALEEQKQPTHCCLLVYLPPKEGTQYAIAEFGRLFSQFGKCILPVSLEVRALEAIA